MTDTGREALPAVDVDRGVATVADGMTLRRRNGAVLLDVSGQVDYRRIEDFRRALAWAVVADRDVVVDLHAAEPLGPGGIRLLSAAARAAATHGRHLRVTGTWQGSVSPT